MRIRCTHNYIQAHYTATKQLNVLVVFSNLSDYSLSLGLDYVEALIKDLLIFQIQIFR